MLKMCLPLIVAAPRLREDLASHTIPIQDDAEFRTSLAREYRQEEIDKASCVPRVPRTALDVASLYVELAELLEVDPGIFRDFASAPGGTKALLGNVLAILEDRRLFW